MPPDAKPKPASSPKGKPGKPGAKGAGSGLKKKVGPLPLWAWVAIIGGAAAAYWFFIRGGSADGGDGYGGPEIVSGSAGSSPAYSPQQAASSGAPGENAALAGQLDPATFDALMSQIGDVRGHVTELEDAFSSSGYSLNDDKTWTGPDMVAGDVVGATVAAAGGVQRSTTRTVTTKKGGGGKSKTTPATKTRKQRVAAALKAQRAGTAPKRTRVNVAKHQPPKRTPAGGKKKTKTSPNQNRTAAVNRALNRTRR